MPQATSLAVTGWPFSPHFTPSRIVNVHLV
jgi:hypothetical protein